LRAGKKGSKRRKRKLVERSIRGPSTYVKKTEILTQRAEYAFVERASRITNDEEYLPSF